jgi:hypothetical protein
MNMNDESIAAKKEIARARKAAIATWTSEFEKEHGRSPTKAEKRSEVGALLAEYEEAKQAYESLKALRAKSKSELGSEAATSSEHATPGSAAIASPSLNDRTYSVGSLQSPTRLAPLRGRGTIDSIGNNANAVVQVDESTTTAAADAASTFSTTSIEFDEARLLSARSRESLLSPMQPAATAEDVGATSVEPPSADSVGVGADVAGQRAEEATPVSSLDEALATSSSFTPRKVVLDPISSSEAPRTTSPAVSDDGPLTVSSEALDSETALRHKKFRAALKGQGPGVLATALAVQLQHEAERIEPELTKLFGEIMRYASVSLLVTLR